MGRSVTSGSIRPTRARIPGILRWLVASAVVLYWLYLAGSNAALSVGLLPTVAASAQENVRFGYERAWTLWPGLIEVEGFWLTSQDSAVELELGVEHARFDLGILPLLRRTIALEDIDADGIIFRTRVARNLAEMCAKKNAGLPPIRGLTSPKQKLKDASECLAQEETVLPVKTPTPAEKLWRVQVERASAHRIEELWIEHFRWYGLAEAEGGFYVWPTKELRVDPTQVKTSSGALERDSHTLARLEHLEIDGGIGTSNLEKDEVENMARQLSLDGRIDAQLYSLGFLGIALSDSPWLGFQSGRGHLRTTVKIEEGRVLPGFELVVDGVKARVAALRQWAYGRGELSYRVSENDRARFDLSLSSVAVGRQGRAKPHIRGGQVRLRLEGEDPTVLKPLDPEDVDLIVDDAVIPDVRAYNDDLPPEAGLTLVSGAAHGRAELHVRDRGRRASGQLELFMPKVLARMSGKDVSAGLSFVAPVGSVDLAKSVFTLPGTTIEIQDLRLGPIGGRLDPERWKGTVTFDEAKLAPGARTLVTARTRVVGSDASRLLALFSDHLPLPGFVRGLGKSPLLGGLDLVVRDDGYVIDQIFGRSGSLEVAANVYRNRGHTTGGVLFTVLGVRAALEIQDDDSTLILSEPTTRYYWNAAQRRRRGGVN